MKIEDKYDCVFRRVAHTTVYELKALGDNELNGILENLKSEMREIHRAVNWVEGIIRLKDIERSQKKQKNVEVKS